jgi:hypothetical protein
VGVAELDALQHLVRVALERKEAGKGEGGRGREGGGRGREGRKGGEGRGGREWKGGEGGKGGEGRGGREGREGREREPHLYVIMWDPSWSTLIHELLQVKVQVFKHQKELPLAMQNLNQTKEGKGAVSFMEYCPSKMDSAGPELHTSDSHI